MLAAFAYWQLTIGWGLTGFLRFWLARQSFELSMLAERGLAGRLVPPSQGALDKRVNDVPAER